MYYQYSIIRNIKTQTNGQSRCMCVTAPIPSPELSSCAIIECCVAVQRMSTGVVRTTEAAVIFVCQPLVVMSVLVLQASLSPLTNTPAPIVSKYSIGHSAIL